MQTLKLWFSFQLEKLNFTYNCWFRWLWLFIYLICLSQSRSPFLQVSRYCIGLTNKDDTFFVWCFPKIYWVAQKACKELTHWKRLWCWEGLGAGGEGDDRGWDGWMASPTRWMWVWVNSGRWWWTGRPGLLQFLGSQRVGQNWATELNWTEKVNLDFSARSYGKS